MISGLRLADAKKLPTYGPEIALTTLRVPLLWRATKDLLLMIRLQSTVPFPPLPELDMGVWEDSLLSGQVSASTFTCYSRLSIYLMMFPAFLLWRYRVGCTVSLGQAGRYFLPEVPSLLLNYLVPAHLQLYFQSYESPNVAVSSQKATPFSMLLSARRNQGSIVLYALV